MNVWLDKLVKLENSCFIGLGTNWHINHFVEDLYQVISPENRIQSLSGYTIHEHRKAMCHQ
jgi:hypothetical protein